MADVDPLSLFPTTAPVGTPPAASSSSGGAAKDDDVLKLFPTTSPAETTTTQPDDQSFWSRVGSTASDVAGYGAGLVGSFTHGLSFGLDNPLDRATAALFPNSAFAQLQPQREQAQQQFQTANPIVSGTAEVAGSLPTYAMGEGALRAAVPVVQGGGIIGTGANLVGSAVRNALVSGAEAAGTTDGSLTDRLEAAKRGAEVGAVAGPVGDVVSAAASPVVRALMGTGGGASAADAALGQLAKQKYGIPVTATDLTDNTLYRIAADQSSKLPFSGAAGSDAAKRVAWQSAIAKEMGENASSFTDDVMSRAKTRIGSVFDNVAKNTTIDAASTDDLINNKLTKIETDLNAVPMNEGERSALKVNMDNITKAAANGNGTISGSDYQALTKKGTPLDRAESSRDPNVSSVAGDIRDALDDAFANSASPQDQAALQQARYQYRVMRTVQDLAAGSRDGNITPDGFMQKVLTTSRRFDAPTGGMAYTGGGNVGELAKIGKLMRAAPQTGTADRALVNALALGAGGAVPALMAHPLYAAGVPAALAANRAAGAYLRSGSLANRIIESSINPVARQPSVLIPGAAAGVNALNRP